MDKTLTIDFKRLINRIEELEKEKNEWKDAAQSYYKTAQSYYNTNQELREQNKRYKQALKEIAVYCDTAPFNYIAKQALEGDK